MTFTPRRQRTQKPRVSTWFQPWEGRAIRWRALKGRKKGSASRCSLYRNHIRRLAIPNLPPFQGGPLFLCVDPRVKTRLKPWAESCRPFRDEPVGIPPITFAVVLARTRPCAPQGQFLSGPSEDSEEERHQSVYAQARVTSTSTSTSMNTISQQPLTSGQQELRTLNP
jgi:hypothetical protein